MSGYVTQLGRLESPSTTPISTHERANRRQKQVKQEFEGLFEEYFALRYLLQSKNQGAGVVHIGNT